MSSSALGHRFRLESDTEVILAAYAEWGLDCLRRFNGIWAFALWDTRDETMVLSRDRFGVKPLFLAESGGLLAFASEIKAILEAAGHGRCAGTGSRSGTSWSTASSTTVTRHSSRGVRRVPAAHALVIAPDGQRTIRYWDEPALSDDASSRPAASDPHRIEEIRDLFVDAVALQLRSDVALGTCLSGGMDSSSIVGVAAAIRERHLIPERSSDRHRDAQPQKAFFAEFRGPGLDEREHVDRVVRSTGVELHTVTPTHEDFVSSLPQVVGHQDEPFASSSIVVQYHVMRLASRNGVKVLLDGQGADELFGGYPPLAGPRYAGLLRSVAPAGVLSALRNRETSARSLVRYGLFGPHRLPALLRRRRDPPWLGPAARQAGTLWPVSQRRPGTVLARVLRDQVFCAGLSAMLRYEDRNSMAFGIEARVPFLDHRLVEAALLLPDRLKIAGGRRKIALAEAMRGIVADSILDRKDKIAFAPPQDAWLRESVPLGRALARASIGEELGYLNPGTMTERLDGFERGSVAHGELWRVMMIEMWLRHVAGGWPQNGSDGS